jgi:hypothetical protein
MLTLIGSAWDSVQSSANHGRRSEALTRLRCLLARPDLPKTVACRAHRLAGELLVAEEKYAKAKRHLRAAAGFSPTHAETFFNWGLAHERDPQGSDRLAASRFRTATQLDPKNPTYRASYGRALVRSDRPNRGARELMAAAKAAPGNLDVTRIVVEGLMEAGKLGTARRVVTAARFRSFGTVTLRELNTLAERVRFETVRCEQRETTRYRHDAELATDGGRAVLPFISVTREPRAADEAAPLGARRDVLSMPRPHIARLRAHRADG